MDQMNQFEAMKNGFSDLAKKSNSKVDMSAYEDEEFIPPDTLEIAHVTEDGRVQGNLQKANYEEQRPDAIDNEDEYLFENGPLASEVESWKKQFEGVYLVDDISDDVYIYRTLNRYEYKAIMATPNTDPLMREEMICETCVLFPYNYSYEKMSTNNAGIVSTLAEHIMSTSGFSRSSMPVRL